MWLAGWQPRGQADDTDDGRRIGNAACGPSAHRVPDQHDRGLCMPASQLRECLSGISHRRGIVFSVPASYTILQQVNRQMLLAGKPAQRPRHQGHAPPTRVRIADGLIAALLSAVKQQNDPAGGR